MRKSRVEAEQTRERIVAVAAGEFRRRGIVATGLSDLMKAAGLTHGGFYKHFESKDQLVAEACARSVADLIERIAARPTAEAAVAAYLSTEHRDHPEDGCPIAAIGSELSRADDKARAAATAGVEQLVAILAGNTSGEDARRRALVAVSTMVGALTMARIVADPALSAEILEAAREGLTKE